MEEEVIFNVERFYGDNAQAKFPKGTTVGDLRDAQPCLDFYLLLIQKQGEGDYIIADRSHVFNERDNLRVVQDQ